MLMGVESEYAIAGPTSSSENLSALLVAKIQKTVRCLRGAGPSDLFLQLGYFSDCPKIALKFLFV